MAGVRRIGEAWKLPRRFFGAAESTTAASSSGAAPDRASARERSPHERVQSSPGDDEGNVKSEEGRCRCSTLHDTGCFAGSGP